MSSSLAHDHPWKQIRSELRAAVGETTWSLWLEDLSLHEIRDRELVVGAPAESRAWIAERYEPLLQAAAARILGADARVDIVAGMAGTGQHPAPTSTNTRRGGAADGALRAERPQDERRARSGSASRAAAGNEAPPHAAELHEQALNPRFSFDQFVIGDSNRFAHAACLSVAELPGLAYNPLYLCGAPGLGKTHLMQSIAAYLRDYDPSLRVRYVTAESFTNHFVAAVHGGDVDRFKAAYREVDVLLVDDVQFLENKVKTEIEFFHTFNDLHAAGAQIVLSSDRPPQDLERLEDRLRERFASGLVSELKPPDPGTRLAILRKRVHQDGLDRVDPAALQVVAERVDHNIRLLEGALIRIVAYASLTGARVDAEFATSVLDGAGARPAAAAAGNGKAPPIDIPTIQERTAAAFGVTVDDLLSQSRTARIAWARQVAMYLARELTDATLPAIGRAFGGRNHSTVINACKRTAERIALDPEAFGIVQRLTAELRSS